MKFHGEKKILAAAAALVEASRLNPVEIVTPINLDEAKKNWKDATLASASFKRPFRANPIFVYDNTLLKQAAVRDMRIIQESLALILDNCEPENTEDKVILDTIQKRAEDALRTADMAACILLGKDDETALHATDKYDTPTNDIVIEAYEAAQYRLNACTVGSMLSDAELNELATKSLSATDLARLFHRSMEYLSIDPWEITVTPNCAAIDVRDRSTSGATIVIPDERKVDGAKAVELACHEIGSHVRGSDNSQKFIRKYLKDTPLSPLVSLLAKSDNETLYEGIAKISDVAVRGEQAQPSPLATIAIDQARRGANFAEVAEVIYQLRIDAGMTPNRALDSAWGTTYRVFRGITDTASNLGCYAFPKDAAYLLGYRKAKLLENKPWYSAYSSLEIEEVRIFSELFPDFKSGAVQFVLKDMVQFATNCVLDN